MYQCDPNLELEGHVTLALLKSMLRDDYMHILEQHGLDQIDADRWYPMQEILNVFNDIQQHGSRAMMDFVSIGMAAADNALFPPEVKQMNLAQFFQAYARIYPSRHRGSDPGWLQTDVLEDQIRVVSDTPYPDDLMYGLFYGFARRFSNGHGFTLYYDDSSPRKEAGGEHTTFVIELD